MDEILNREELDNKMVDDAFQHLVNSYLATKHRKKVDIITKAFNFAKHAHKGVRRLSGEPYIMHPLAVSKILLELGMDYATPRKSEKSGEQSSRANSYLYPQQDRRFYHIDC